MYIDLINLSHHPYIYLISKTQCKLNNTAGHFISEFKVFKANEPRSLKRRQRSTALPSTA